MTKKLVIFDCDGVLVDSEHLCNRELRNAFLDINIDLSEEEIIEQFTGKSREFMDQFLMERLGRHDDDWYENNMLKRRYEAIKAELKPIENIELVINYAIKNKAKICVASSSSHYHINLCLKLTNLNHYFEGATYSAHDVGVGKPEPDIFLHALNSEGFEKSEAMIIEDSYAGVIAAQRAEIECIGYIPPGSQFDIKNLCKYTITSMKEFSLLPIF